MKSGKVTRAASAIWLVGGIEENFRSSKLPSRGEVLKVLFNFREPKQMSLKDSVDATTELLLPIWNKARIPTKASAHVVEHIRKLHGEWQGLKKHFNRTSATNLSNQQMFQESLDDLFDIAHRDAMSIITIDEDREFLQAQREKGRRGTMGGVDRNLVRQEERVMRRRLAGVNREARSRIAAAAATAIVELDDSSSDSDSITVNAAANDLPTVNEGTSSTKQLSFRGTVPVVTRAVAAALDRTNTSDRNAAHILSAIASTSHLRPDIEDLIISPSAIRRARMKHREAFTCEVKATFDPTVPLILHWDGKIMDDYTAPGRERVDRLPILVSGHNVVKLLSVPKLHDGTAATTSQEIVRTMDEWGLRDRIKGLCFDTTASNTGVIGGVCVRLETEMDRHLLNLACRHHVAEIMLEKVFSLNDVSKSPNMEIFGHFRDYWPRVDQNAFSTAMNDETTAAVITPWRNNILDFALAQLETFQPRDDYRELLELTIIFLGGVPPAGVRFRYPGAIHRARWMARAIYSIKMWLFRGEYNLQLRSGSSRSACYSDRVWEHLKKVCLFVTSVYVKYWFQTPSSAGAPRNDLNLLHTLSEYPERDVAKAAITAFGRHLWYLSELLVGFSFFDDDVSADEKRLMVVAIKETEGSDEPPKRVAPFLDASMKQLHHFVTRSTGRFFEILGLSDEFLDLDPAEWGDQEIYKKNRDVVRSVKVVNDLAERGVALIQEFNASITRNEEQKQYLLQVIEDHRREFPAATKGGAVKRARNE
jgi:hypothetical protein